MQWDGRLIASIHSDGTIYLPFGLRDVPQVGEKTIVLALRWYYSQLKKGIFTCDHVLPMVSLPLS
jgi:hypothetical protein